MALGVFTLFTALLISAVAGWYSIIGLTTLFAGAFWSIIIMGSVLEIGKLVTCSWLYQKWKTIPIILKTYLCGAVVILMFITSMGIFGYLSKAHLDQALPAGDVVAKIERINVSISRQQRQIDDADLVLKQLDNAVQILMDYDRIRGDDGAIATRKNQKDERDELNLVITDAQSQIDRLIDERIPYETEIRNLNAEVGPIKYIAELLYGDVTEGILGSSVRFVILILVVVFDPLAVALVIAGNMTIREELDKKPKPIAPAEIAETLNMEEKWEEATDDFFESEEEYVEAKEEYTNAVRQRTNMKSEAED